MKTALWILVSLGVMVELGWAQELQTSTTNRVELKAGKTQPKPAEAAVENPPALIPQSAAKLKEMPVAFGGFLVDLVKSEEPIRMVDPRTPLKGKSDSDNLFTDPETGKVKGVVFFAIRF